MAPRLVRTRSKPLTSLLLGLGIVLIPAAAAAPSIMCDAAETEPHTPPVGSSERQAIFDGLNDDNKQNLVFIVKYLKVENGWAWVAAIPHSPDYKRHYPLQRALLHFQQGIWLSLDGPCAVEGCNLNTEMARIRAAHPTAPAGIFPKS